MFYALSTFSEGFLCCLQELELRVVFGCGEEVYYSCELALLFYCLVCFCASSLQWSASIVGLLLCPFLDDHPQYLEYRAQSFGGVYLDLVLEKRPCNFGGDGAARGVWLCVQEGDEVR